MSEFQQYEFRAIDRPLSKEERAAVSSWSSRTIASGTGATFTYHYGDFPKDEITVVEQYFDAMLYTANWGSTRLIFKFPRKLVDVRQLGQYSVEGLEVIKKSDTVILDIDLSDEEGDGRWEEEVELSSLLPLRSDIIAGDYRCLYLVWLKVSTEGAMSEWGDVDPESEEPDVPPGLSSLSGPLSDFAALFGIGEDLIAAAAAASPQEVRPPTRDLAAEIAALPEEEKNEFLTRLLRDEPLLSMALKQRLTRAAGEPSARPRRKRRTVAEIIRTIGTLRQQQHQVAERERAQQQRATFERIEEQESNLWQRVDTWIAEKNARSYDEAIRLLQDLKSLALYKDQYPSFYERVVRLKENNSRLSALKAKIDQARLLQAS